MTTSVVGLFDSIAQAQKVSADLQRQGIPPANIQILANDSDAGAAASRDTALAAADKDKGFFQRLGEMLGLTDEDEDSRMYRDRVRSGSVLLAVRVDQSEVDSVVAILQRHDAKNIDEQAVTGQATAQTATNRAAGAKAVAQDQVALPVIEEELRVGKRAVQRGGVRIYANLRERPVEESIKLQEERVRVERRPVDRPVTDADLRGFQPGTFEVTERAEEAVVSKQARIVEEVVVSKQVDERTEAIRETVRSTDVEVEPLMPGVDFDAYSADFQRHFASRYAKSGGSFEQYTPAYRYGLGLATSARQRGATWSALEAEARRGWESQQPGTWERFKDAIQYAWDYVSNKVKAAV